MSAQPKIVIYGSEFCTYCKAARIILRKNGLQFENILVSTDVQARQEMEQRCGCSSVPQVFIGEECIGGFDELYELDQSGLLKKLLGGSNAAVEK